MKWLCQDFPVRILNTKPAIDDDNGDDINDEETNPIPDACGCTNDLRIIGSTAIVQSAEDSDLLLCAKKPSRISSGAVSPSRIFHFYVRESASNRRLF